MGRRAIHGHFASAACCVVSTYFARIYTLTQTHTHIYIYVYVYVHIYIFNDVYERIMKRV